MTCSSGVHDGFVVNSVLPGAVFLGFLHAAPPPAASPAVAVAMRRSRPLSRCRANSPAAPHDAFLQGANLQRDGSLVICGDAGIKAGAKHVRRFPFLAENLLRFRLVRSWIPSASRHRVSWYSRRMPYRARA